MNQSPARPPQKTIRQEIGDAISLLLAYVFWIVVLVAGGLLFLGWLAITLIA